MALLQAKLSPFYFNFRHLWPFPAPSTFFRTYNYNNNNIYIYIYFIQFKSKGQFFVPKLSYLGLLPAPSNTITYKVVA
jgi:hypothetical protein